MAWIKCNFHLPDGEIRAVHFPAARPLKVGDPVGFDDEFVVVIHEREDGSADNMSPGDFGID